jgi:hypothetical protein
VKPSNCFIIHADDGEEDQVKLIDFGIAKDLAVSADPTGTGMVLGTPGYLAPELVNGECAPSPSTDVYSLGVTLYKLLTHRLPWEGRFNVDVLVSQRQHAPHPVGEKMASFGQRMPRAAEVVVMTAFAVAPAERYPSARAFAAALREILNQYPDDVESDASSVAPDGAASPVSSTRRVAAEPGTPRRYAWLQLLVAAVGFVVVLWAVPAAPARPLAPVVVRPLAAPVAAPVAPPEIVPLVPPVIREPGPDSEPAPEVIGGPQSPPMEPREDEDPRAEPAPRTRPFKPAVIRKDVEDEHPYLLRTCAPKAPGYRSLVFTLVIAPSGRLTAVQAKPKALARCVQDLWRHARFDASDEGGSYTHRLIVPSPLPALLEIKR